MRCSVCGTEYPNAVLHSCAGSCSLSNLPEKIYGNYLPDDAPAALRMMPNEVIGGVDLFAFARYCIRSAIASERLSDAGSPDELSALTDELARMLVKDAPR